MRGRKDALERLPLVGDEREMLDHVCGGGLAHAKRHESGGDGVVQQVAGEDEGAALGAQGVCAGEGGEAADGGVRGCVGAQCVDGHVVCDGCEGGGEGRGWVRCVVGVGWWGC